MVFCVFLIACFKYHGEDRLGMADVREFVLSFIGVIVGLAVAISLVPVISSIIATSNLTGVNALLVGLIPTLITVGIMLFAVRSLF
jgi:hypothetical protein